MNWSASGRARLYSIRRPPPVGSSAATTSFMRLPRLPLTRIASPAVTARATIGASAAESAVCAPRIAAGTASNSSRISGPQANRQIGGGGDLGGEARDARRGLVAEFQHVAEHGDAPPRRLQAQHRERRAHRGGVAVVAFVEQQRGAAGHRDLPARATAGDRREALQRTSQRSRPDRAPECRGGGQRGERVHRHVPAGRVQAEARCVSPAHVGDAHRCRRRPCARSSSRTSAAGAAPKVTHARATGGSAQPRQQRRVGGQHRDAAGLQRRAGSPPSRRRSPRC